MVIIEPRIFEDSRGYFFESFSQREFEEEIRPITFVQDNESKPSQFFVPRGFAHGFAEKINTQILQIESPDFHGGMAVNGFA